MAKVRYIGDRFPTHFPDLEVNQDSGSTGLMTVPVKTPKSKKKDSGFHATNGKYTRDTSSQASAASWAGTSDVPLIAFQASNKTRNAETPKERYQTNRKGRIRWNDTTDHILNGSEKTGIHNVEVGCTGANAKDNVWSQRTDVEGNKVLQDLQLHEKSSGDRRTNESQKSFKDTNPERTPVPDEVLLKGYQEPFPEIEVIERARKVAHYAVGAALAKGVIAAFDIVSVALITRERRELFE
ncbi:hypothetical protein B0H12DRAFT_1076636 [Mycena haematopus]|nr:hypothetical protein B0H12DRAFT_1076636 [Mycena haematopus]